MPRLSPNMRRIGLTLVTLLALSEMAPSLAFKLGSDEELARAASNPVTEAATAPAEGAPLITIERPNPDKPIKSPVSISVRFQGDAIDVKSLTVTYGYWPLAIDVTKQILAHAQVSASGLTAENAELPLGHHHITINVSDSAGRVGSTTVDFTVI